MRNYEGETRLQGIGEVEGIQAKNLVVGDYLVLNFGVTEEITNIELSKTGKTLLVTVKWFNKQSQYIDGKWVGEWKESIRKYRLTTIVVVKELNPVVEEVKEELEIAEKIENNQSVELMETKTIDEIKENTLEKILMKSLNLETRKSTNSDKIRKLDLNLECDLAYIRCKFKRMLKNIDSINLYNSTNKIYVITKELFTDNCKHLKEKYDLIKLLRNTIIDFQYKNLPVSSIKFEGMI